MSKLILVLSIDEILPLMSIALPALVIKLWEMAILAGMLLSMTFTLKVLLLVTVGLPAIEVTLVVALLVKERPEGKLPLLSSCHV